MIRTLGVLTWALILCSPLCTHGMCDASQYQASVIPTAPDEVFAIAEGIGNTGIVFGSYGGPCPAGHFLWPQRGRLINLTPDVWYCGAPNASGQLVGGGVAEDSRSFAAVREANGSIRHLAYLNPSDTWAGALAISDGGVVIGGSRNESSSHIVLWELTTGAVTQIAEGENGELYGTLGSAAINSTGYTAWTYVTNRRYPDGHTAAIPRSFRRNPSGDITELSAAAGTDWFVQDVADDGTALVGGWLWNTDGTLTRRGLDGLSAMSDSGLLLGTLGGSQVVLGTDGGLSYLAMPVGATSFNALDINNRGEVVGWAAYADGNRAVIWEPVPEPSAFAVLACGLVGVLTQTRKRRSA